MEPPIDKVAEAQDRSTLLATLPPHSEFHLGTWNLIHGHNAMDHSVVVFDDDSTGTQMVHDVDVLLQFDEESLLEQLKSGRRGFFILTNTRALDPAAAEQVLRRDASLLKKAAAQAGCRLTIINRCDSMLRGHFPLESNILAEVLGPFHATLHIPYFEAGGRLTIGDIHYLAEKDQLVPVALTPFARDAAFGFKSSNLRDYILEKSGGRIADESIHSISLEEIRTGGPEVVFQRLVALPPGSHCIINAAHPADMEIATAAIIAAELHGHRFLHRAAAQFVSTRLGTDPSLGLMPTRLAPPEDPLVPLPGRACGLIIVGSQDAKTTAQLACFRELHPEVESIELKLVDLLRPDNGGWLDAVASQINRALMGNRSVIVFGERVEGSAMETKGSLDLSRSISNGLCHIVGNIMRCPSFVITTGGMISSELASKGCGGHRATVKGQVRPGVSVWHLFDSYRWKEVPFAVFPSDFGEAGALAAVFEDLASWINQPRFTDGDPVTEPVPWSAWSDEYDEFHGDDPPDAPTPPLMELAGQSGFLRRPRVLRAGPIELEYDEGGVRYLRSGTLEVVRRIYAAVRDKDWGTIPGRIEDEVIQDHGDTFEITFLSVHKEGMIDFAWEGRIRGESNGTLHFEFEGTARSTFLRNRIGLCVLHPQEASGQPCQIRQEDGSIHRVHFPDLVAMEQPIKGMTRIVGMTHEVSPGSWVDFEFSGDLFDTEDQRNWVDASFKTFCTPISLPYPVEIRAGTAIHQSVTVRWRPDRRMEASVQSPAVPTQVVHICTNESVHAPLFSMGLGISADDRQGTTGEGIGDYTRDALRSLPVAHLRGDLQLGRKGWADRFDLVIREVRRLEKGLELAIHLPESGGQPALESLGRLITRDSVPIVRMVILTDGRKTTQPGALALVRKVLPKLACPIGVGTDGDFFQLNQHRPAWEDADFISWTMNPQVHATDLSSIAETPSAVAAQLRTASQIFPGKPLVIGPITLKPRGKPVPAKGNSAGALVSDRLPADVDSRQLSLFCAGWTIGMIAELALGGAASVTFFETIGWKGMVESSVAESHPGFPSEAGTLFPVFHVLRTLGWLKHPRVHQVRVETPHRIRAFRISEGSTSFLIFANLTPSFMQVMPEGILLEGRLLVFDGASPVGAEIDPETDHFFEQSVLWRPRTNILLPPFAWAILDDRSHAAQK